MNVAMITQQDVMVTPPFDDCLPGITIQRLMELVPEVSGVEAGIICTCTYTQALHVYVCNPVLEGVGLAGFAAGSSASVGCHSHEQR